ncbi:hypothetical protein roselon_02190 [Roseibacterium elongatum DSM 19469]|uniref:Uncharacterized protein n=1 Tax=Roseicyclus elongatus DSM 19469 TaxID=1294273 RepID=W8SPT1_9RHOB|nr:hypothetical protein roselon_02190 [Roseibacterium elongatum DSM 19469]
MTAREYGQVLTVVQTCRRAARDVSFAHEARRFSPASRSPLPWWRGFRHMQIQFADMPLFGKGALAPPRSAGSAAHECCRCAKAARGIRPGGAGHGDAKRATGRGHLLDARADTARGAGAQTGVASANLRAWRPRHRMRACGSCCRRTSKRRLP